MLSRGDEIDVLLRKTARGLVPLPLRNSLKDIGFCCYSLDDLDPLLAIVRSMFKVGLANPSFLSVDED